MKTKKVAWKFVYPAKNESVFRTLILRVLRNYNLKKWDF